MEIKDYPFSKNIVLILERLNQGEGEGFLVGGSLRDILLGKEPKDFDFATNLSYHNLKKRFQEYTCREIGKSFGVLQVKIGKETFEIAKFRTDLGSDGRRPESVCYVDTIEEDLARRDFTINAMAYNEQRGLIDPYEGREDLKNRKIRFIGKAEKRIQEDGLRIMRAFRFVSQLGFSLDSKTKEAIFQKKGALDRISKKRITEEWNRLLEGDFVRMALEEMRETAVLEWLFPGIEEIYDFDQKTPYHEFDLWEHTLRVVTHTKKEYVSRLAALLHDIAKPKTKSLDEAGQYHFYGHEKSGAEMVEKLLKRHLEEPKKVIEEVLFLVENHMVFRKDSTDQNIKKYISKFGQEKIEKLIDLSIADDKSKKKEATSEKEILRQRLKEIVEQEKIPSLHDLKLDGFDLMKLGLEKQEIQKMKEYLLEKCLSAELENSYEALLEEVQKKIKK